MKLTLRTLAVAAVVLLPSLAFADGMDPKTMTCKDFSAMDTDGMMKATEAMHMASPDSAMAMDADAMKMATEMTMKHCDGKPDMMAMDAMMMK